LTDAPKLIEYLYCGLSNIYFCWLNQTLALIFRYILYILIVIQSFIMWIIAQGGALLGWIISSMLACLFWLGGVIQNQGGRIVEAVYYSGGHLSTIVTPGSTNFFDVLLGLINGVGGIIHDLSNLLNNLVSQLGGIITTALSGLINIILALINAVFSLISIVIQVIGVIIVAIVGLLAVIVETIASVVIGLIGGILGGFNTTVSNPLTSINALAGASTSSIATIGGGSSGVSSISSIGSISISSVSGYCANNVLIHLCIGEYILDNTLFSASSPVTYGFFILIGMVWFHRILWALGKLKGVSK
jgi:phage-related protein